MLPFWTKTSHKTENTALEQHHSYVMCFLLDSMIFIPGCIQIKALLLLSASRGSSSRAWTSGDR